MVSLCLSVHKWFSPRNHLLEIHFVLVSFVLLSNFLSFQFQFPFKIFFTPFLVDADRYGRRTVYRIAYSYIVIQIQIEFRTRVTIVDVRWAGQCVAVEFSCFVDPFLHPFVFDSSSFRHSNGTVFTGMVGLVDDMSISFIPHANWSKNVSQYNWFRGTGSPIK